MSPVFYALGVIDGSRAASPAPDAGLVRVLDRVIERLRILGPARLQAPFPGRPGTVADAAHELSQQLADTTARLEGRPARPVPRLADHAAADQLAVLARDLLVAISGTSAEAPAGELTRAVTEFGRGL